MKYRIRFTKGTQEGETFFIENDTVSIGRSHSNDIKVDAPDVSGKHVILSWGERGITLNNLSSRKTLLDDIVLDMGGHYDLFAGQSVTMGEDTSFVLETLPDSSEDEKTRMLNDMVIEQPQSTDDSATVITPVNEEESVSAESSPSGEKIEASSAAPQEAGEPTPSPAEEQTIAMQTRMASPDELEYLRGKHQKQRNKKIFLWSIAMIVVVAAIVTVYGIMIYRTPEKFVTWPQNSRGQDSSGVATLEDMPLKNDIGLEYPLVENTVVENTPGKVEIFTRLGKYRDVPFRMILEYNQDKNSLTKDRVEFFEEWIARKAKGDGNWNFDFILPLAFYQTDHGIPYLSIPYSRTVDNESYFGFAVLIRHMDWNFMLMKEIPTRERWRAERFIQIVCFFQFSDHFLMTHWEGMKELYSGTAEDNLLEAKALLTRHSPSVWEKAEYLLRSVLCKLHSSDGNEKEKQEAVTLLRSLRRSQVEWFNAQKIAFFMAKNKQQDKEINRIRETTKAVFSSEEDLRFHKIRQDKWD